MDGSIAGHEESQAQALEYARRAGSHWEETLIVRAMGIDFYWGPTPVAAAIAWCDDIRARAPDDRAFELGVAHALAHMHARLGNFGLARSLAARCIEIAAESGLRGDAISLSEVAADVETLAGNHEAAERILREACDAYVAMGKPDAVHEALHGLTQVDAGMPVDVDRLEGMVAESYISTQALLHSAIAAARLVDGRLAEAEVDARFAVDYFATTDMITFHANSALILGDVLRAAGRTAEADAAFTEARDLYQRKGSVVSVRVAEARLAA